MLVNVGKWINYTTGKTGPNHKIIYTALYDCKLGTNYKVYGRLEDLTSKFHGEFMSPALFLFEVLKMVKLTRGPLVLYHLPKY